MSAWTILAFADAPPGGLAQFLPLVLVFAIFYFLIIAPMRKRQKQLQGLIEALKKGDRVVTNGGIYGEISAVDTSTVILKIADNVKIRVAKSAIAGLADEGDKGSS